MWKVDWEEYLSHYLRDLLGLEEETIKQVEKKPDTLSRDIKVGRQLKIPKANHGACRSLLHVLRLPGVRLLTIILMLSILMSFLDLSIQSQATVP